MRGRAEPLRGRRFAVGGVGLVLALLVAGVWLLPGMLDWNRYRAAIATLASQQLGRPVQIDGAVNLQFLPQPILTAAGVSVSAGEADGVVLRADALRLRVALGPLLAGKVDARELTLQGADLRLPWPPPSGALMQRPPPWLTGLQARVEHSRLQVGDLAFTEIDANLATDPDTGTLSAAGTGRAGARTWQFTARLARPGRDGSAGLDVSLDGQGRLRDTGGTFSGQVGADGALAGRVAGRGPDLSALMPAPAVPWRGDGRLSASGGLAVADELSLEIGGVPARGAVALRVTPQTRLDVAIATGRLDLDAWLPALLGPRTGSLRSGIPTGIDLSAEAASLAGGLLRQLRAGVELGGGAVRLRDVMAVLPGETRLALTGRIAPVAETRFEGDVQLVGPDLRSTLRWLQPLLPEGLAGLPAGVLRTADLHAHVVAEPAQAIVTDVRGMIDGAALEGSVLVKFGARLGVTLGLKVDRLSLDTFVPDPASLLSTAVIQGAAAALRALDLDVKLGAERADWAGVALGPLAVELQGEATRLTVRRLEAQPLGAKLSVSGQMGEVNRVSDGRLELTVPDLAALRPLLDELPVQEGGVRTVLEALRRLPHWRGPGSLVVLAAGPPDGLTGRVTLELGDLRIEAQPTVNLVQPRLAGSLTLHHPGAPRMLETLGLGQTAAWLGDGSLSLVGQVAVMPGRLELESGTLSAGALRAGGRLVFEGGRLTGEVKAETLPLPLVYPRSPEPLPLMGLRRGAVSLRLEAGSVLVGLTPVLQAAGTDVSLEAGVLRLSRLTGRVERGSLSGGVVLDAAADPPRLSVQGRVSGVPLPGPLFESPLDLAAGQMELTFSVAGGGWSPAALLATSAGQGRVRVQDGLANGFDLAGAAQALTMADARQAMEAARTALMGGSTPFARVVMPLSLSRGVVTVDGQLSALSGEASLAGTLDLAGGALDMRLGLVPAVPPANSGVGVTAPVLGARVTGPATAPRRTPELAGLARWLADRP